MFALQHPDDREHFLAAVLVAFEAEISPVVFEGEMLHEAEAGGCTVVDLEAAGSRRGEKDHAGEGGEESEVHGGRAL